MVLETHYASRSLGDLNDARSSRIPAGGVLGSDVAGVVTQSVPGGPPAGARVVASPPP